MADEVLGITGSINFDDIQSAFDKLISSLGRVGAKTDELSATATKALSDIAKSADSETNKTEAVLNVLKQSIAKATEGFVTMPKAIQSAQEQVDKMQQACAKLEEQFGKTVIGTDEFGKLSAQLTNQQSALAAAKDHLEELKSSYGNVKQNVSALQSVYDKLFDSSFESRVEKATVSTNGLTAQIIDQKREVGLLEIEIAKMSEAYKAAVKDGKDVSGLKTSLDSKKDELDKQRQSLIELTAQRDKEKLSLKELKEEYAKYKDTVEESSDTNRQVAQSASEDVDVIGQLTDKLKGWALTLAGGMGIKEFVDKVVAIRGEFEDIETKLQTMLGSEEKMQDLMAQMKDYALISPLTTKDMANALQMMIGFGIDADKSVQYLKALGDISMGNTQSFNSLALAFSQMSAAGKLMGQDLNQMINAGFNPLQTMSEKTGKSIGQLKNEMSEGAISAEMVQQAFIDATSEGGKFYGMAEAGSKTINGQMSMLEESFDNIFNDIGTQSEGVILTSIQSATTLVEHYKEVGGVIASLVTAYGGYKAALIANIAIEKAQAISRLASIQQTTSLSIVTDVLMKKTEALNAVMSKNPYAIATALVVGMATAIYTLTTSIDEAEEQQNRINNAVEKFNQETATEQAEVERLFDKLKDAKKGSTEYQEAKDDITNKYGTYLQGLSKEIQRLDDVKGAYDAVTSAILKTAKARGMESAIKSEQEAYGNAITNSGGKLYEALKGKLGEERGTAWYNQIKKEIERTGKVSAASRKSVGDLFKGEFTYGKAVTWMDSLENAKKNLDSGYKKINTIFGGGEKVETPTEDKRSSSDSIAKAREKEYQKALKEYNDFVNNKKNKLTTQEYDKERQRLKSALDTAKKKRDESKPSTDKDEERADRAAAREEKKEETERTKREKAEKELENELRQIRIDNEKSEIDNMKESHTKKMREYDNEHKDELQKIKEQAEKIAKLNKEAGKKGTTESLTIGDATVTGLTKSDVKELNKSIDNANASYDKSVQEVYKQEAEAMRNYLKEYGTYQQQKLAIAEEYAEKIRKAQESGDVAKQMQAEQEYKVAIEGLDMEELKKSLDWEGLFNDLDKYSTDALERLKKRLQNFLASNELSPENIKVITDLIDKINATSGSKESETSGLFTKFKDIKRLQDEADTKQQNYDQAKNKEEQAEEEARQSRLGISESLKKLGIDTGGKKLTGKDKDTYVKKAQEKGASAKDTEELGQAFDTLFGKEQKAAKAAEEVGDAQAELKNAQEKAKVSAKEYALALAEVGDYMGDQITKAGQLLGELGMGGLGDTVSKVGEGVTSASGAVTSFMSGDYFGAALQGVSAIKSFGSALGIGNGSNAQEVADKTAELAERNEILTKAIEDLTEEMKNGTAKKSLEAYEKAVEAQQTKQQNLMDDVENQAGYHNAHHSWSHTWYGFDKDVESYIKDNVDSSFSSDWSAKQQKHWLYSLSPEQMSELLKSYKAQHDISDSSHNSSGSGYGKDVLEKLKAYAEEEGKMEDLTDSLNEKINGISFQGFRDNFVDALKDMDTSASDLADNIEEYLWNALVNDKYSDAIDEWAEGWYDNWTELNKKLLNGEMTQEAYDNAMDTLRKEKDAKAEEFINYRNELADAFGYDGSSSSQSASGNAATEITQDQADELNGRMTALQYNAEQRLTLAQMANAMISTVSVDVGTMKLSTQAIAGHVSEILDIQYDSLANLQKIVVNTNPLPSMKTTIENIYNKIKNL